MNFLNTSNKKNQKITFLEKHEQTYEENNIGNLI